MEDKMYLIFLSVFPYFGPARTKLLLSYFKKAKNVWNSKPSELIKIGFPEKKAKEFSDFRDNFDTKKYLFELKEMNIDTTTILDKDFPESLMKIDDCPVVLYYKGSLKSLKNPSVSIVGTRKMTSYGKEVTEKFAGVLASFGITIISGLARGIDTKAHESCMFAGGTTVAVLGNGLESIYPPENKNLADEIIKKGGAIISEFPLHYPALPVNFAIRNRIVSGLSDCVLVIEGAAKSGTLLTASHAADQGKTVFAVPGEIFSPLSAAPLFLLKNGARLATDPKDILEELDVNLKIDKKKVEKVLPDNSKEAEILKMLENEALYLDELVRISGEKTSDISARLTIMEMKGLVRNLGGGKYKRI